MKGAKAHSKNSKRIASGAGVLLIGRVVTKMFGALYRIVVTNKLGAEGMGILGGHLLILAVGGVGWRQ